MGGVEAGEKELIKRQSTYDSFGNSSAARGTRSGTSSCNGHDTNTFSDDATTKLIMHRFFLFD